MSALLTREAEELRQQRDELLAALRLLFERANRNTIDPFSLQQAARAIAKVEAAS